MYSIRKTIWRGICAGLAGIIMLSVFPAQGFASQGFAARDIAVQTELLDVEELSDWVPLSDVPEDMEIAERKWTYTRTVSAETADPAPPDGFTAADLTGAEWIEDKSASRYYVTDFPAGFDRNNALYAELNAGPYVSHETETERRLVSNREQAGYVYWHWAASDYAGYRGADREILDHQGMSGSRIYDRFGAFFSERGDYSLAGKNNPQRNQYIVPERTAYSDCQGSTRWFRFPCSASVYTDFHRLWHYQKAEALESGTEITPSDPVSDFPSGTALPVIGDIQIYVRCKLRRVSAPTASYPSGSRVPEGTLIELYCATEGAEILYTTNGEIPTARDVYTEPIPISGPVTIYAKAVKDWMADSPLEVFSYTPESTEIPLVSTLEAEEITPTGAKFSAEIQKPEDVLYIQFVYYQKNNSKAKYTVRAERVTEETDEIETTGEIIETTGEIWSASVSGLSPDTEYWFQARAVNEAGWNCGYIQSFMTGPEESTRPASVTLDPGFLSMNIGNTKTLLATVLPASALNRTVYWSSADPAVATVDQNGAVTAVGLGNTEIQATTVVNRLTASCRVQVISDEIAGDFDFSEANMMTNAGSDDPYGFDHAPNDGGNAAMASAYLARWDGPVLEEADPYPASLSGVSYHEYDSQYHLQNILYLPYRKDSLDNDEIKSAVMKYGAVFTALKINYACFSNRQSAYYLPPNVNRHNGGHAVVIAGWDDEYPASAFSVTPEGDGAFLCKNSWGPDSGDGGYFYVSYYDKTLAREACGDYNAVFYGLESGSNYNKIYQYDYLGPVSAIPLGSRNACAANVFPEHGGALDADEILRAVSCYNYAPGTGYEIYVTADYTGPDSLRFTGDPAASGVFDYAGYFTVELDQPVALHAGSRFAVIVRYAPTSGGTTIFAELPVTMSVNGRTVNHSSKARANPDESYISNDGKNWIDFTALAANANVCIKAFTESAEDDALLQEIENLDRAYVDDTVSSIAELSERGFLFHPAFLAEYGDAAALLSDDPANGDDDSGNGDNDSDSPDNPDNTEEFGFFVPSVLPDLNSSKHYAEGGAFPVSYDLRREGCMTPVRNQGEIGSCWTFAAFASLESAILKRGESAAGWSPDGLSQSAGGAVSLEVSPDALALAVGDTAQLSASLSPAGSTDTVLWTSSNPAVAMVSASGVVTAIQTGNAEITAYISNISTEDTGADSISAVCLVTVTEAEPLRRIALEIPTAQLHSDGALRPGETLLARYTLTPANCGAQALIWSSGNGAAVSVDSCGLLTAVAPGTAQITLSNADGTVSDTVTVTVAQGVQSPGDNPDPMKDAPFVMEITENTLIVQETELSGALALSITNRGDGQAECRIIAALYTGDGQLLRIFQQKAALEPGPNTVRFSEIALTDMQETELTVKVFALTDDFLPAAAPVSDKAI